MKTLSLATLSLLASVGTFACGSTDKESVNESAKGTGGDGSGDGTGGGAGASQGNGQGPCGVGDPSGFDGDEACLAPPSPEEGLQVHIGPSSYDDPDVINATDADGKPLWLLQPGEEPTQCYRVYTPNTEGIYYFRQQYRMRPGSHHMIISTGADATVPEGWEAKCGSILNAIGGTQHTSEEFPPGDQEAPEDQGIARGLQPKTPLDVQLHFYNTTTKVKLREVWFNFLYKPKSEVTTVLGYLGGFAPVNVAPHTSMQTGGTCDIKNAVLSGGATTERIVTLFGHSHSHNTRFAVYWDKADGSTETVYDNYDWAEASTFTYNSIIKNPEPDATNKKAGAFSGQLILNPGEKLRYQCDIQNDTDLTLRPVEKVFEGEMCNLFGTVAGLGFPCFDLSKSTTPPKPAAMP